MLRMRNVPPLVALFALALAACQKPGTETGTTGAADTTGGASAEARIDSLRTSYVDAWNARNWDAIEGMMTSDYHEIGPAGEFDHDQAVAAMRDTTQMPPADAKITIEAGKTVVSGDVAYESGSSTVTATGPDGQPMTQRMNYLVGFREVDGQWKIDRVALAPPGGTPADTSAM